MRKVTGLTIASLAVWAFCGLVPASAQTPATAPAAVKPAEPPAAPPQAPPMRHAEIRSEITGALGWKVGIPANAFSQLTFLETAEKAEALGVMSIEGFSSQKVSADIAKNLDTNLSPDELTAIKAHLTALHLHMPVYHAGDVGKDESTWSKLFDFAKALGIETIACNPDPASLTSVDTLASNANVNVAIENGSRRTTPAYWDPKELMKTITPLGKRIGVSANIGQWMQQGIKPIDGLSVVSSRLMVVSLQDRSALKLAGKPVSFGTGVAGAPAFLMEMSKLERPDSLIPTSHCGNCSRPLVVKPIAIVVQATGAADPSADLERSLVRFEKAVRPAFGEFIDAVSRVLPITSIDDVPAEDRVKIEAALPKEAAVKPIKARKLLIMDLCPAGGYYHATIAHGNLALGLMGKQTGAYEAIFDNNLDNLKYPKIKQYDAVFLNSADGEYAMDPVVMNSLLRYVREGGGLAGLHATSYASPDIPEFGELIGAQDGPHKVETVTLKIDDPASPLTKPFIGSEFTRAFGGTGFTYTDEFYHFLPTGPYSREKLHVLTSIDTDKSDMSTWHVRPDNDYATSWIKSYGKGRVFNCSMGHTPTFFQTPELGAFLLSAIQFVLGDLPADTTPSAKLAAKKTAAK